MYVDKCVKSLGFTLKSPVSQFFFSIESRIATRVIVM